MVAQEAVEKYKKKHESEAAIYMRCRIDCASRRADADAGWEGACPSEYPWAKPQPAR